MNLQRIKIGLIAAAGLALAGLGHQFVATQRDVYPLDGYAFYLGAVLCGWWLWRTASRTPDVISAALRDALLSRGVTARPSRAGELTALKAEFRAGYSEVQPQYDFLMTIREELPEDGLFVDEVTQVGYVAGFAFPVYRPRTLISSGYQGTLGYGFATALGVKVAHPDRPVVSVNGDGGLMYTISELATAVQQGIGLVAVVFADGAFGNVLRMQEQQHGGRVIASRLRNPDFVKLAESFGAHGERAAGLPQLRQALRDGFNRPGPTLIEVPVGPMPSPWKYVMMPRVRG